MLLYVPYHSNALLFVACKGESNTNPSQQTNLPCGQSLFLTPKPTVEVLPNSKPYVTYFPILHTKNLTFFLSLTKPSIYPKLDKFLHILNYTAFSMESVASNSVPSDQTRHRPTPRPRPPHPITDRIVRAIRHNLLLLHRYDSSFFVLGATANVYTVTLSSSPSCTCPDRLAPCKHILFVLIRVLGVSLDDPCIRRQTLRPCQLDRLLSTPSLPGAMAGSSLRQIFHRHFYKSKVGPTVRPVIHIEEGTVCPICLEEMTSGKVGPASEQRVVACGTCRNPIHEECLMKWKRSRGRRPGICAICRARWRGRADQDKYVNLGAYVNDDIIDRVDDDEANSHCNE